jgi:hypothetical protein
MQKHSRVAIVVLGMTLLISAAQPPAQTQAKSTIEEIRFLSRYAPGGGMLWGHRHPFAGPLYGFGAGAFLGMEPAGDYPIHIIVKNGRVTLLGVVDNEGDKTIAGMKARQVPGSFEVNNELMVEKKADQSTKR